MAPSQHVAWSRQKVAFYNGSKCVPLVSLNSK
jgi:hypothetical protein